MNLLPDFEVRCSVDGTPASGLPVLVQIKMREKNDYHHLPGLTDAEGKVSVESAAVEADIEAALNLFPSDYGAVGGANSAFAGVLSVHAMNVSEVEAALRAYDLFHAVSPYPKDHRANLEAGYRQLLALAPRRIDVEILSVRDGTLASKITTGSLAFPAMASAPA